MELMIENGIPVPILKHTELTEQEFDTSYFDLIKTLRFMYYKC